MSDKNQSKFLIFWELIILVGLFVSAFLFGSRLHAFAAPLSSILDYDAAYSYNSGQNFYKLKLVGANEDSFLIYDNAFNNCVVISSSPNTFRVDTYQASLEYPDYYYSQGNTYSANSSYFYKNYYYYAFTLSGNNLSDFEGFKYYFHNKNYVNVRGIIDALLDNNSDMEDLSPVPDPDDYVFSSDLGYLSGLADKSTYLKLEDKMAGSIIYVTTDEIFNLGWNSKSTTDLNFFANTFDSVQVQLRSHVYGGYYDGYGNLQTPISEYFDHDPFPARNLKFTWSKSEQLPNFEFYNAEYPKGMQRKLFYEFYFRLIAEKDGQYYRGGWVCLHPDASNGLWSDWMDDRTVSHVTIDSGDFSGLEWIPDSMSSDSGFISHGQGVTIEDAQNNISNVGNTAGLVGNMESLVTQIGYMPMVISSVFSFLPGWSLELFGVSFGCAIALIIWKVARG